MTSARKKRLSESKRYLTKLLIIASLIKHNVSTEMFDIGAINRSEYEEAEDLAKHGSTHIPELLENVHNLAGFGKCVIGWSHLSVETGILDVIGVGKCDSIIVGLPDDREITCVQLESEVACQFRPINESSRAKCST